jgi:histidine phosphotransferase ChpT
MTFTSQASKENAEEILISPVVLELLASRICHDLISPVGAVHNGIEFLQDMGEGEGEAVGLISHSAGQASAKLQAFRFAYGAGGRDPNIKPEDVFNTFENLISTDGKVTQEWDPHGPIGFDNIPPGFCKILMGVLILSIECMPRGGNVVVEADTKPDTTKIVIRGDDVTVRDNMQEALNLTLPVDKLEPRSVHAYVTSVLASLYGFWIELAEQGSNEITLKIHSKP